MLDKLSVVGKRLRRSIAKLAREKGRPHQYYETFLDLRPDLPAFLYFQSKHTGRHKVTLAGVSRLGWPEVRRILEAVFPDVSKELLPDTFQDTFPELGQEASVDQHEVWISRIDLAVNLVDIPLDFFLENLLPKNSRAMRLDRGPRGHTFYPYKSDDRTVAIYDLKRKNQKGKRDALWGFWKRFDHALRLELSLRGRGIPWRSLRDLPKYREMDLLQGANFHEVRINTDGLTPIQALACIGLRSQIATGISLEAILKTVPSPHRPTIKRLFLRAVANAPDINARFRRRFDDWFRGLIRFPR
jgi:hypothetical protein